MGNCHARCEPGESGENCKASSDRYLSVFKITNDGRKLGLDQRLISPFAEDDPTSKLNLCVDNIMHFWEDGREDKLTQLVFCDLSTPKKDGTFNVYDDIKHKLMERGVPESEVAFIHDAETEIKKKELFAKVRSGKVRVLIGSTQKLGAGTNIRATRSQLKRLCTSPIYLRLKGA